MGSANGKTSSEFQAAFLTQLGQFCTYEENDGSRLGEDQKWFEQ